MDTFSERYAVACERLNINPVPAVVDMLSGEFPRRNMSGDGAAATADADGDAPTRSYPHVLDLRAFNLPPKACIALSEALANDLVFRKVKLSDALIGDDGCAAFANGLKTNATCQVLDLRGNNLRADGGIALAQMLKINTSLKKLVLEWNCLGLWDAGLAALADSLGMNATLTDLDLRNNKVAAHGFHLLAEMLRRNATLRRLDLRWNNGGLSGGRALLDALKYNTTVTDIQLAGNDVPADVLAAIESALERNRSQSSSESEKARTSSMLRDTLTGLSASHTGTIEQLTANAQASHHETLNLSKKLHRASIELEKGLMDRRELQAQVDELSAQLKKFQAHELDLEEAEVRQRKEWRRKWKDAETTAEQERKLRDELEAKHRKEVSELHNKHLNMEADLRQAEVQIEVAQRAKKMLAREVERLQEELDKAAAEHQDKLGKHEKLLNGKWDKVKASSEEEMRRQFEELQARAARAEQAKAKSDEMAEQAKAKLHGQRLELEERIAETELRVRREEHNRVAELDAQLHPIRAQLGAATAELDTLRELKAKDTGKIEALLRENSAHAAQISELRNAAAESARALAARDGEAYLLTQENAQLRESVTRWEFVSKKMREEEITRMTALDEAIGKYLQSAQVGLRNIE